MTRKRKPDDTSVPSSGEFWRGVFAGMDAIPMPLLLLKHDFQTAPKGTCALEGEPGTIDWFYTFRYPIGGQQTTEDGLRRRREAIETLVAPHVTTRKFQHAI